MTKSQLLSLLISRGGQGRVKHTYNIAIIKGYRQYQKLGLFTWQTNQYTRFPHPLEVLKLFNLSYFNFNFINLFILYYIKSYYMTAS